MTKAEVVKNGKNWYVNITEDGKPSEFIPCRTKKLAEDLAKRYNEA